MSGTEQPRSRRQEAIAGARLAIDELSKIGVEALIVGSLARGTFGPTSDVDFLVTKCPPALKYAIEGRVEDSLGGIPFDLVYLDEIPARKLAAFVETAVHASRLR